ncbi:hypothetical protein GGR51DRAFT_258443 [Nemania sp. FL0031]|nr:hypothetical protein GGR51DRAFT_258443 [Nemania sp. FL0031]
MTSRIALRYLATIHRAPKPISIPLLRPYPRLPRTLQPVRHRLAHSIPKPTPRAQDAASSSSSPSSDAAGRNKKLEPHYLLTFTCVPCAHRSTHTVSKQGYHNGSVLITCPGCRNRHVISDNLNIFGDRNITVEDLLREKGQLVKKGTLGEDGDIEFWQDDVTDTAGVEEAGAESVEGEGGKKGEEEEEREEARRLRETRDPSSQTTDPTPSSASVLPGDTGTRPSIQSPSHQNPTPSTRRQYHTKAFKPPSNLRKPDVHPNYRFNKAWRADEHTSKFFFEAQGPYDASTPEKFDRNQIIASLRNELRLEGEDAGNPPIPVQIIERPSQHRSISETREVPKTIDFHTMLANEQSMGQPSRPTFSEAQEAQRLVDLKMGPAKGQLATWDKKLRTKSLRKERYRKTQRVFLRDLEPDRHRPDEFWKVKHVRGPRGPQDTEDGPLLRLVSSNPEYKGPRLVSQGDDDGPSPIVQVKPGVVGRHRPPGGPSATFEDDGLSEGELDEYDWPPDPRVFDKDGKRISYKDFPPNFQDFLGDKSKPGQFYGVRHVVSPDRPVMETPEVRHVASDVLYKGPRFIRTENENHKIVVQARHGIIAEKRPPGGVFVNENPPVLIPDAPAGAGSRKGFFRPSFLPIMPDPDLVN